MFQEIFHYWQVHFTHWADLKYLVDVLEYIAKRWEKDYNNNNNNYNYYYIKNILQKRKEE
jgi:hypothetical protein